MPIVNFGTFSNLSSKIKDLHKVIDKLSSTTKNDTVKFCENLIEFYYCHPNKLFSKIIIESIEQKILGNIIQILLKAKAISGLVSFGKGSDSPRKVVPKKSYCQMLWMGHVRQPS